MSFNQEVYRAGDFAYIEPTERGMEYSVVLIERLWTNAEGQQMLYGNLFYRPSETYHVASRKFLDKELFKSDAHVAVPLAKVAGRCCVLSVKDYFRMQPEGFLEKDVYVCESRYSTKARAFKKIKVWNFDPDHLKLISRDKPLEPKRVISVYKERLEKHKEEIAELEEGEKLMEKERPVSHIYNIYILLLSYKVDYIQKIILLFIRKKYNHILLCRMWYYITQVTQRIPIMNNIIHARVL